MCLFGKETERNLPKRNENFKQFTDYVLIEFHLLIIVLVPQVKDIFGNDISWSFYIIY